MKHLLRELGIVAIALFALSFNALAACQNGASNTNGSWINYNPTVAGMTGITVSQAVYQVDANCNITIVVRFYGTADAGVAPTFTVPYPGTLPFQTIPGVFANVLANGNAGGGLIALFVHSDNKTYTIYPFPEGLPSQGEWDEYRITGTYR